MSDILLWQQLQQEQPPAPQDLIPLLNEVSTQPLKERAALLGDLLPYLRDEDPNVRAATFAMFSSATGYKTWKELLRGLNDPEDDVRLAALRALHASAQHDPHRWMHVLLHPRDDIRAWGMDNRPKGFPDHLCMFLLSDPTSTSKVLHLLDNMETPPEQMLLLLDYMDQGIISAPQTLDVLSRIPWQMKGRSYFDHLGRSRVLPEHPETPEKLEELITHPLLVDDHFDRVNSLLWQGLDSYDPIQQEQSQKIWNDWLYRWSRGFMNQPMLQRIATSIARVGFREWDWHALPLSLCARAFPAILLHTGIPLELRRQAIALMQPSYEPCNIEKELEALLKSSLCLHEDGHVHLETIGNLLRLNASLPYKRLLEHIDEDAITASLLAHPDSGPTFLSLPPQNRKEKKLHNHLLRTFVEATQDQHLSLVANLVLQLPVDCLSFVQKLANDALPRKLAFLQYVLDQTEPPARKTSEKKIDRLSKLLVDILHPNELTDVLKTLLHVVEPVLFTTLLKEVPDHTAPDEAPTEPQELRNVLRTQWQAMTGKDLRTFLLKAPMLHPLVVTMLGYIGRRWSTGIVGKAVSELPFVETACFFTTEQQCTFFPYEQEQAFFEHLRNHSNPQLQELPGDKPSPTVSSQRTLQANLGPRVKLTKEMIREWGKLGDLELQEALAERMPKSLEGLCRAFSPRTRLPEDVIVGVATLLCADPYEDIALLFEKLAEMHPFLMDELDSAMTKHCERMKSLPLLAVTWLYRWDRHHDVFISKMKKEQTHVLQALQWSLGLPSSHLLLRMWKAIQRWVSRWRWHHKEELAPLCPPELCTFLVDMLLQPHHRQASRLESPPSWARRAVDLSIQEQAATILAIVNDLDWHIDTMEEEKQRLIPFLPGLASSLRITLRKWLPIDGEVQRTKTSRASMESVPSALLQQLRQTFIAHKLKEHCFDARRQVVEEAASQLVTLEAEGVVVLLSIIVEDDPPHLRCLTDTIALWEDKHSLHLLRKALPTFQHDPERMFLVASGLCERGEPTWWPHAVEALHQPVEEDWFLADDWLQLERLPSSMNSMALELVRSPLYGVYSRTIHHILSNILAEKDAWNTDIKQALVAFLSCGPERLPMIRRRVARRLKQHGAWEGLPILFTDAVQEREGQPDRIVGENEWQSLWTHAPHDLIQQTVLAGLLAGDESISLKRMLQCLKHPDILTSARQQALLRILRTTQHPNIQQESLQLLEPTSRRDGLLNKLATTFAWGIQRGRELTGKIFRIEMIGGNDFGYTRLNEARIFVNPLPLLREVQQGERILKGLILHEIGHHVYHGDPESQKLWKQAQEEGIGKILNLVADEQLERSLRAKDKAFGDDLKLLAAFAFQHNDREMHVEELLLLLGVHGFPVLSQTPLQPARKPSHVILSLGKLFFELESQGFSFPRFVRALRMGLGNRHKDPKVARALKLFTRSFRNSNMAKMMEISREIRNIFQDEIKLLTALSQDSLWSQQNNSEVTAAGEGLTSGEIQREVERILRGRPKPKQSTKAERVINLSDEEQFSLIHNIVPLIHNPSEHRKYKLQVARWSDKMREYFRRLGLGTVPQRRRLSGYRLNTPGLSNSLLRGDPRILMARKTVFKTDLFVGILVDCSGSMVFNENIERAKLFASLLAEAAAPLTGVDARFFGFTDTTIFDAGNAQHCAVHALESGGGNNDAAALWHASQIAIRSCRKAKLLIMISDGAPTECSVTALRSLVKTISERMKICCAQVAVHPLDEICFPHYVEVADANLDLAIHRFGKILAQLVRRALQG